MFSESPPNESARFANQVSRKLRSPLLWLEPDHTSNTTHALAESDCQIRRLLKRNIRRMQDAIHAAGRFGLSVPLRWRPAHGCGGSKDTECTRLSTSNSCTLRASSKRGTSMHATGQVIREQVQSSFLCGLSSPSKREMRLSSSSRLTPPSRGQLPAYGLQLPLMSNVRRQMVQLQSAGPLNLSNYGRSFVARTMFEQGIAFTAAAALVDKHNGNASVVLHLLCQGVEIVLKAILLSANYKKYRPQLRSLGHRLSAIAAETRTASGFHVFPGAAGQELKQLEEFYTKHLLRYAHSFDIFIDAKTIPCRRVARHVAAIIRLCQGNRIFEC